MVSQRHKEIHRTRAKSHAFVLFRSRLDRVTDFATDTCIAIFSIISVHP
mgnify:CR=1 FL=1